MPTLNQEQISALIQFIEQAEDPGVITNVIVAAVLYWLYDKANDLPNKTDKDPITGALTYSQFPPIVLRSMDSELDGVSSIPGLSDGDLCYNETLKKIVKKVQSGLSLTDEVVGDPMPGIIYCNAYTGNLYRWLGSSWNQVGGKNGADAQTIANVNKIQAKFDQLIDTLAGYALTEPKTANMKVGKLDWSSSGGGEQGGDDEPTTSYSVEQNLTDLDSDYLSESIQSGGKLTIHLSVKSGLTPASNLYVIDDDGVEVIMGEEDVTASAYNPATGTIEIDEVTGDVEITASAITYVSNGLVLMFDGKNKGETQNQWKNLADADNPLRIETGYTLGLDYGIAFDTPSSNVQNWANFALESGKTFADYTTEAVFKQTTKVDSQNTATQALLATGASPGPVLAIGYSSQAAKTRFITKCVINNGPTDGHAGFVNDTYAEADVGKMFSVSHYGDNFNLNGEGLVQGPYANIATFNDSNSPLYGKVAISGFLKKDLGDYGLPFLGSIYCVRMYSRVLTTSELDQNFKVDKKRFNIN